MLKNAIQAKQQVDDNTKNSFDTVLDFINEIIDFAINDCRYYCLINLQDLIDRGMKDEISREVMEDIKNAGYGIEYLDEGIIRLDWSYPRECEAVPRWIKRHRFDGEFFYECSNCRGVAMQEKKKRMS